MKVHTCFAASTDDEARKRNLEILPKAGTSIVRSTDLNISPTGAMLPNCSDAVVSDGFDGEVPPAAASGLEKPKNLIGAKGVFFC